MTVQTLTAPLRPAKRRFSLRRILLGGSLGDLGRLPRYLAFMACGLAGIWAPIVGYLKTAPLQYTTEMSLILPGSGASASVNLNEIGQASSSANSAFASNAVSPTETYKRLIGADRILGAAARRLDLPKVALGKPRIELVDQTSLIHIQMTGPSPIDAQSRGDALLAAFFAEIDALRADELHARETSGLDAIDQYRDSVLSTRDAISRIQTETGLLTPDQFANQVAANDRLSDETRALENLVEQKTETQRTLETVLGRTPAQAAATLKLFADGEYLALVEAVSEMAQALADAGSQYGANHPKVTAARSAHGGAADAARARARQVTGLDGDALDRLDLAPDGARAALLSRLVEADAERAGLALQLLGMRERLETESARLEAMAPSAARLEDMSRDFSVAEAVFASAIARSQSGKADVYASYPLVQVLENPSLPDAPSSPRRKLALAAGVAASFMLLVALIMGWVRLALIDKLLTRPVAAR